MKCGALWQEVDKEILMGVFLRALRVAGRLDSSLRARKKVRPRRKLAGYLCSGRRAPDELPGVLVAPTYS